MLKAKLYKTLRANNLQWHRFACDVTRERNVVYHKGGIYETGYGTGL